MIYKSISVRAVDDVTFIEMNRPAEGNSINDMLVSELAHAFEECQERSKVVVLSGSSTIFCMGADFQSLSSEKNETEGEARGAEKLYDLWLRMANGSFVTISLLRGKANAGGIGFLAASDIVLAEKESQLSMSELLFGLYPACVMPFLIRRMGFQKAHYLALTTQAISGDRALEWGLVDAIDADLDALLRRHLIRLRCLSKKAIGRYKSFLSEADTTLTDQRAAAVAGNLEVFTDPDNLNAISRYVDFGLFPWEEG